MELTSSASKITHFIDRSSKRRKWRDRVATFMLLLSAPTAVIPLFAIFAYVLVHGFPGINLSFFVDTPRPVGDVGGGMGNALLGTCILVAIASAIGIPWGIATGVYLSEYGKGRLGSTVRFCVDLLASVPSIVIGLFAYAIVVLPFKTFSAMAGGVALSIIIIPTIARTTEEILALVPTHIREAGLALGLPRWRVIISIVIGCHMRGIMTGVMLALARATGETAPLLFTAFNNRFWSASVKEPISSLPVQIFTYAISPFEQWHTQAWAGALVLVAIVFTINIAVRLWLRPSRIRKAK